MLLHPELDYGPTMKTFTIDGPGGSLEARLEAPDAPIAATAVLAHPHPQMGGTMDDAVLDAAARALVDRRIACLRFNFRGAGGSAGSFDGGDGERDDLRAALAWLREAEGVPDRYWLVGYSFGSWVGWRVAVEDALALDRIILIAPPMGMLDYPDGGLAARHAARFAASPDPLPAPRIDVFAGTADAYVDLKAVRDWAERNAAHLHALDGANHFFTGQWDMLCQAIGAALDAPPS